MINLDADAWGFEDEKNCVTKKESNHLKGEFYLKLICKIDGQEIIVSEVNLEDFNKKLSEGFVDNIYKSLGLKYNEN